MEATMTGAVPYESVEFPMTLEVPRALKQSRLTNFPLGIGILIRAILLIPHYIVLWFLGLVAALVGFIADFAILFTGNYPRGLFNFSVGVQRWGMNLGSYLYSLRDEYPPFSMERNQYPVTYEVAYPEKLNRILNFPIFGLYIKLLLAIPHYIVLMFLLLAAYVAAFIAQFAILFTGSYPAGLHRFNVGVMRWNQRIAVYAASMTDKYPPFSLS